MNTGIAASPPRVFRRADPVTETLRQRTARCEEDTLPYMGQIYPAALGMTGNHADAEDLVQETLTGCTPHSAIRAGTNLRASLYRILTNTFFSSCRKRHCEPQPVPVGEIGDRQLARAAPYPSSGLRPAEAEVLDHLPDSRVVRALRQLPGAFRTVLYLADVEGYACCECTEPRHPRHRQLPGRNPNSARDRGRPIRRRHPQDMRHTAVPPHLPDIKDHRHDRTETRHQGSQ